MRWLRLAATLSTLLALGCAGSAASRKASLARWQRVCAQFGSAAAAPAAPASSASGPTAASAQPTQSPTAHDMRALRTSASRATPALVHIRTVVRPPQTAGADADTSRAAARGSGGTGVIIDAEGLILTNAHVVRDATEIRVVCADGGLARVLAVASDPVQDLALLRVELATDTAGPEPETGAAVRLPRALPPNAAAVCAGQPVVSLGVLDGSEPPQQRVGVVLDDSASLQARLDPSGARDYSRLIESSAPIEPGFSGGPLLDRDGRFVGLNVAVRTRPDGTRLGYALRFGEPQQAAIARLRAEVARGQALSGSATAPASAAASARGG